ncbi:MAG: TerD family protein [Fluviicoccus sp.]|uniref:TerD family protein n=1 Tax=Fluviicoccus sp. TaxID=2003552 RepID=UPI002726709C|nr:TerD family protein [Fluviicoccus sp.]MDO8330717.1 TerD family protein [Fluviicoccus sp.]
MAISLQKGGNVNLSKEAPSMQKMTVGLGWNPRATDGDKFDLDAIAFLLNTGGKVGKDADFIFFNNKASACGSVTHTGDNTTGEGDGDDEQLVVDLSKIPADVDKVTFCVTIHQADQRRQNFGQVSNAFIRIVNNGNNQEVARYDLSEDGSTEAAMIFGELYRNGADWKFRAVGQGFKGGLGPLAASFGVNV